jgi:hypothetical protein
VLNHFSLSYSAQPFFAATVLMHPRCYSAQSLSTTIVLSHTSFATMLSYSSLLQRMGSLSHFEERLSGGTGAWGGSRLGRGGARAGGGLRLGRVGAWLSHGCARSPGSIGGWTVGSM